MSRSSVDLEEGSQVTKAEERAVAKGTKMDSRQETLLWQERVHRYGIAVLKMDRLASERRGDKVRIMEIRVKTDTAASGECLVIVKAVEAGRKVVGFASALDPSEALRLAVEKVDNASMRFRVDKPYQPPE